MTRVVKIWLSRSWSEILLIAGASGCDWRAIEPCQTGQSGDRAQETVSDRLTTSSGHGVSPDATRKRAAPAIASAVRCAFVGLALRHLF